MSLAGSKSPLPVDVREVVGHTPDPESRFKQKLLEFLATQAKGAALPVVLSALLVVAVVWNRVPMSITLGWISAVIALILFRWKMFQRLATSPGAPEGRLRRAVIVSFVNGFVHGAAAWLFFGYIDQFQRTIVTMIMIGWASGSVAVTAGYRPSFLAYSIPSLGPLAAAWAVSGGPISNPGWVEVSVALIILLFGAVQTRFAQTSQQMFRATFDFEQELARERDRAESASRAKSRFLASASHDLRQPLHTIALFGAALSLRVTEPAARNDVKQLNAAIESLNALLNTLLDLSKLDAGVVCPDLRPVEISAVVTRAVEGFRPVAESKGLYLAIRAQQRAQCDTDPQLFERIVNNLVDNAIKYTERGGVTVEVRIDNDIDIVVADTGHGIPAAEQEHIFEEFYQLGNPERDREKGLGLGLAIVQRTAELLGVKISLSSKIGSGTTFHLRMPCSSAPAFEHPAGPSIPLVPERGDAQLRVLVLDDEAAVRDGMASLLTAWGWAPILAATTEEALEGLARSSVDAIVADFRLRNEETGLDAIRRIRETAGDVPTILITGEISPERLREAIASDFPVLHKPVDPTVLRLTLENVVERGIPMAANQQ
jgi:two-component system, sensor histidine kinase